MLAAPKSRSRNYGPINCSYPAASSRSFGAKQRDARVSAGDALSDKRPLRADPEDDGPRSFHSIAQSCRPSASRLRQRRGDPSKTGLIAGRHMLVAYNSTPNPSCQNRYG